MTRHRYSARDIEVLEGLEPVRRRPGMYVGGTDERACHHLFCEILDNAMDEVIAGHARRIDVCAHADGSVSVRDDGRGIPVDTHPDHSPKSALEVIMTTLHAGGKFSGKSYRRAGGLHGVGAAVVNALSEHMEVEIARSRSLYRQTYSRGAPTGPLVRVGAAPNRRGTWVRFRPDSMIFGADTLLSPRRMLRTIRAKAYVRRGVEIHWTCEAPDMADGISLPASAVPASAVPASAVFRYPGGLSDLLAEMCAGHSMVCSTPFSGRADTEAGACEWAVAWSVDGFTHSPHNPHNPHNPRNPDSPDSPGTLGNEAPAESVFLSYCNAIETTDGGTHVSGLRTALTKSLRNYGALAGMKNRLSIGGDDMFDSACALISVFIDEPEFVGQTKERLSGSGPAKLVENAVRDRFDHWLAGSPSQAAKLIDWTASRASERLRRRRDKDIARQNASRRLRLPGKLTDCSKQSKDGTEIFLVEGDSAGGSAKQARDRKTQAILPLRGKILNVATAGPDKLSTNKELNDLVQALGCGLGETFRSDDLRYERIIIMTDADVDGAHIAALLITFFYLQTPDLIAQGRLYLAQPPLYRLQSGNKSAYARDEDHKTLLLTTIFRRKKVAISRFKGLGEMMPAQLKSTTMDPASRTLIRVSLPDGIDGPRSLVTRLMGKNAGLRFAHIRDNAPFTERIDA